MNKKLVSALLLGVLAIGLILIAARDDIGLF